MKKERGERSGNQAEEHCGRGKSWYNGTKDRKEVSGFKNRPQAINYPAVTERSVKLED